MLSNRKFEQNIEQTLLDNSTLMREPSEILSSKTIDSELLFEFEVKIENSKNCLLAVMPKVKNFTTSITDFFPHYLTVV